MLKVARVNNLNPWPLRYACLILWGMGESVVYVKEMSQILVLIMVSSPLVHLFKVIKLHGILRAVFTGKKFLKTFL